MLRKPRYRADGFRIWKEGTAGRTVCVVPNQSVVSPAYAGGRLFGGTSTRGAMGADPDYAAKPSFAWRDGVLLTVAQDPDHVYGAFGDQIFKIGKSMKALTVLLTHPGMEGLTADGFCNLYYKINERLHRFAVPRP